MSEFNTKQKQQYKKKDPASTQPEEDDGFTYEKKEKKEDYQYGGNRGNRGNRGFRGERGERANRRGGYRYRQRAYESGSYYNRGRARGDNYYNYEKHNEGYEDQYPSIGQQNNKPPKKQNQQSYDYEYNQYESYERGRGRGRGRGRNRGRDYRGEGQGRARGTEYQETGENKNNQTKKQNKQEKKGLNTFDAQIMETEELLKKWQTESEKMVVKTKPREEEKKETKKKRATIQELLNKKSPLEDNPNFSWDNIELAEDKKLLADLVAPVKIEDPMISSHSIDIHALIEKVENMQIEFSNMKLSMVPLDRAKKGMTNIKNNCYMNAVLQMMIACPPFYNFLETVCREYSSVLVQITGGNFLVSMVELFKYFEISFQHNTSSIYSKKIIDTEQVFHHIINDFNPAREQQDAQEFFSYLLDNLHKEVLEFQNKQEIKENKDEGDEWHEVGAKKKTLIHNNPEDSNFTSSIVTEIFGGMFRSEYSVKGSSSATVTFQPFFVISLDICKYSSIEKCIEDFFQEEIIDDAKSPSGETVQGKYKQSIDKMPNILILHLKRFIFNKQTLNITKIQEHVKFEHSLKIEESLLSHKLQMQRQDHPYIYHLFGVIMHHGTNVARGHYTSICNDSLDSWKLYDDKKMTNVPKQNVTKANAYILCYKLIN